VGTGELIASLVSGIDSSFDAIHQETPASPIVSAPEPRVFSSLAVVETTAGTVEEVKPVTKVAPEEVKQAAPMITEAVAGGGGDSDELRSARDELQEIFDELKDKTGELKPLMDFETHYSLGLAYKDMELLDEAISEFQMAFRAAGTEDLEGDCINCCNMLGVCFKRKQMPKVAVMWFERGLKIPNRTEDEYQALRFEIGLCFEEMDEIDKAIEVFTDVYGIDVNYRKVAEKIKQLRAGKP